MAGHPCTNPRLSLQALCRPGLTFARWRLEVAGLMCSMCLLHCVMRICQ